VAEIIDLAAHRRQAPEKPSLAELELYCREKISDDWERAARNNRLNEYFTSCVPIILGTMPGVNYLADLNALSVVEGKINLPLELLSPGASGVNQLGWVASFKLNGTRIMTPFMPFEAYARCFNILLFLMLGRELIQHGIAID
jgi:hypothetical protein